MSSQPGVQVLMRVDESTFEPVREKFQQMNVQPMGADHPAAWTREVDGGGGGVGCWDRRQSLEQN